jgi:RND superfamily putative drug exporter
MRRELARAAEGATQIADGARQAQDEVSGILDDPVGRRALDRLLVNQRAIADNPELLRALDAYISPDGHVARLDLVQADRFFSTEAMAEVAVIRRAVRDFLANQDEVPIAGFGVAGANAESADIWAVTQRDQVQTWVVVPLGVFLILLIALRNPLTCLNLVLTMVLTYLFALGATHLVFVTWGGAEGLDWKVPLFLFVLLIAVGVDYNIFLMSRLTREAREKGLRPGIAAAIGQTGGLISSAAAITACSFASFLTSPLASIRQLGFALVVGIAIDALLVRPILVPCGHWLLNKGGRNPLRRLMPPRRRGAAPHVGVGP